MDLLSLFRRTRKVGTLEDAKRLTGLSADEIYSPVSSISHIHVYCDSFFIVELMGGGFYCHIGSSEWSETTREAMELQVYIQADQIMCYSAGNTPTDLDGMSEELAAFETNHHYVLVPAEQLVALIPVGRNDHLWYVENYMARLKQIKHLQLA